MELVEGGVCADAQAVFSMEFGQFLIWHFELGRKADRFKAQLERSVSKRKAKHRGRRIR